NLFNNLILKEILILLDGCVTCKEGGIISELRITHLEEEGGIFSGCKEEKEYEAFSVSSLSIKIPPNDKVDGNTASFTVPAVLMHRICDNIFYKAEPKDKYENMKLHIKYSCGQFKSTKVIRLPSIDVKAHEDRVAEITGLWVNLDSAHTKQYVRKGLKYFEESFITKWEDPHLECWTEKECKLN
ncbi:hypothetical protein Mgra_00005325, partial [Meloidogyne graminicola]